MGAGDGSCDLLWSDAGMQSGPRLLYTSVTLLPCVFQGLDLTLSWFPILLTLIVYNYILNNCGKMIPKFKAEQCALGEEKKTISGPERE